MRSHLLLALLLCSCQASPSDWQFWGTPIQNHSDTVALLQEILDACYPLEVPLTISVQFNTGTSSGDVLADTWVQMLPTDQGYRPSALLRQHAALPSTALLVDFQINLNPFVTWYYGTDGQLPAGQEDLVTILLHEVHHGLGALSGFGARGQQYYPGNLFDAGLDDDPAALTSGHLLLYGIFSLYAPSTFTEGISISHFDPSVYAGTPDQLFCPYMFPETVVHTPGPAMLQMMPWLGWQVRANATALLSLSRHNRYGGAPDWWQQQPLWGQFLLVLGCALFGLVLLGGGICVAWRALRPIRSLSSVKGFHPPVYQ
jgi:hypothetical protein